MLLDDSGSIRNWRTSKRVQWETRADQNGCLASQYPFFVLLGGDLKMPRELASALRPIMEHYNIGAAVRWLVYQA